MVTTFLMLLIFKIFRKLSYKNTHADWLTIDRNTELARAVDVMMARGKRIYILIIKVDKLSAFYSSLCFLKQIENMFSVFLSSYTNTRESLEGLEAAVGTLACGSCFHSISRSPKLPIVFLYLDRNTVHVFYFLNIFFLSGIYFKWF